tara:strand:- start:790 stop:1023 length:234 start_codon:yes stop_codon:yes gene_type:complete
MGILDKLTSQGSQLSKANGANIDQMEGAKDISKLHDTYSINNEPTLQRISTQPSKLSLKGITPSVYKNPENGGTFGG